MRLSFVCSILHSCFVSCAFLWALWRFFLQLSFFSLVFFLERAISFVTALGFSRIVDLFVAANGLIANSQKRQTSAALVKVLPPAGTNKTW